MATIRRRQPEADAETQSLLRTDGDTNNEASRHRLLDDMRQTAAAPFEETNAMHVGVLTSIWFSAFPDVPFELPSERWKELGFQGRDPRTDLRGAGFMGLAHLRHFLLRHRQDISFEDGETPLSAFPLSIASINCTAMLLSHLHFAPKLALAFLPGARAEAPTPLLSAFLSLGMVSAAEELEEEDEEATARVARLSHALEIMHARLLLRLHDVWQLMLSRYPATTILDFPVALRATFGHLQRSLRGMGPAPWHLGAVLASLDDATVDEILRRGADSVGVPELGPAWSTLDLLVGLVMRMCNCSAAERPARDARAYAGKSE